MLVNYDIDETVLEYCKKIFSLSSYKISNIRIIIPTEAMTPDKDSKINSFDEILVTLNEGREISMCIFSGIYENYEMSICVDFDALMLTISGNNLDLIHSLKREIL